MWTVLLNFFLLLQSYPYALLQLEIKGLGSHFTEKHFFSVNQKTNHVLCSLTSIAFAVKYKPTEKIGSCLCHSLLVIFLLKIIFRVWDISEAPEYTNCDNVPECTLVHLMSLYQLHLFLMKVHLDFVAFVVVISKLAGFDQRTIHHSMSHSD